MRFLADMGVSGSTLEALRREGHDAVHLREEGLQRLTDPGIIGKARREKRVVLTFDLGFGELVAAAGSTLPSIVSFRLHDQTPSSVTPRLRRVIHECAEALAAGAIVVVEDSRYRVRRLPIRRHR